MYVCSYVYCAFTIQHSSAFKNHAGSFLQYIFCSMHDISLFSIHIHLSNFQGNKLHRPDWDKGLFVAHMHMPALKLENESFS